MKLNDDLKRLVHVARECKQPVPSGIERYSYEHATFCELTELKQMSPAMVNAMLSVEWPESMTATEQVQAMFCAAIDAILTQPEE